MNAKYIFGKGKNLQSSSVCEPASAVFMKDSATQADLSVRENLVLNCYLYFIFIFIIEFGIK